MTLHVAKPDAEISEKELTAIVVGSKTKPGAAQVAGLDLFVTHFATCEFAALHRRATT